MRVIRSRAQEWNIDPARIGAIGFSAGGELVNMICARGDSGQADASDSVERQNSKPTFQALIYPGRSGDIQPTKDSPPASSPALTLTAKTSPRDWPKCICVSEGRRAGGTAHLFDRRARLRAARRQQEAGRPWNTRFEE